LVSQEFERAVCPEQIRPRVSITFKIFICFILFYAISMPFDRIFQPLSIDILFICSKKK